jgi:SAM-dependent methyltransferase
MKLIDAIKQKGKPYHIQGTTSTDLANFIKNYGCKVGVEIGVYKGEYTKILADTGMTIYGVDPWGLYPDYPRTDSKFLERQQFLYEHAKEYLKNYPNVSLIRKTSMDAVTSFPVESLDFIYIDGNHKFKYIAEDLYEWAKRVKPGGIVAGHDYYNSNDPAGLVKCKDVIDAYVKSYDIENFYTLAGHMPRNTSKSRDRWKSWFWIKK